MSASTDRAHRAHLVAIAALPRVGPALVLACHRGDPEAVWRAIVAGRPNDRRELRPDPHDPDRLRPVIAEHGAELGAAARSVDPLELLAQHECAGRRVLVLGDAEYPARLVDDPAPPAVLFAEGSLAALQQPTVAVVGTRNATATGRAMAADLAGDLVRRGVGVVSGLALGIDGAAHRAVVAAHRSLPDPGLGSPIGVIASGLDRVYPRHHGELHRQVVGLGLLLSEAPLGSPPLRWRFPARNRIIAALGDAVVVVESRSAGGSMLTASEALRRDRPVLAVPGHPRAPAAAGALDLLHEGAAPVRDVDDVLVAIGLGGRRAVGEHPPAGPSAGCIGPVGHRVVEALATGPRSFAEVVADTGLSVDQVAAELVALEAGGHVVRKGSWFEAGAGR